MYSDTITLFNRYDNGINDVWLPTVLRGVDLNIDRGAIVAKYGGSSADNAVLHVKYEPGGVTVGGKPYLPPKQWKGQSEAEAAGSLTFTPGQDFDFFIVGEWGGDFAVDDADYLDGFYSFANKLYDYCFAVTSAAKYSVIPHFEILAK